MGRTRIGFRLSEEMKERWEEHAEESRYDDTLSDFVKRAAEKQIDRDSGESQPSGSPSTSEASGEVLDRIQDLQNELHDLQKEVSEAVDAVHAQEGLDPDLQPTVLNNLPDQEEDALTVAELSNVLHESPSAIRFALENIRRNTSVVQKKVPTETVETESGIAESAGEPLWWREE